MPAGDLRSQVLGLGIGVFRLGRGTYASVPRRIAICGMIDVVPVIGCAAVEVTPAVTGVVVCGPRIGVGQVTTTCPAQEVCGCPVYSS
jgi:hypothetical protein